MPARLSIGKKLLHLCTHSRWLLCCALVVFAIIATSIQLTRYTTSLPIEWAGEAASVHLQFDKSLPYSGRFIFIAHSVTGQRMIDEYLKSLTGSSMMQVKHHALYTAMGVYPGSLETHPYLDYFALASIELAYVKHLIFSKNPASALNTSLQNIKENPDTYLESLFTRGLYNQTDNTLVNKLRFLIQHAVQGSYIRFSVFLFYYQDDNEPLLLDLLAAAERGVHVQLITDLPEADKPEKRGAGYAFQENFSQRMQAAALKGHSDSWIKEHAKVTWSSKNHTKIFLFSDSAGFKNWVIITSENLTDTERQKYQAGFIMRDQASYKAFDLYWNQILQGTYKDFWAASNGKNLAHFFFPQRTGDDAIYQQLDRIKAAPQGSAPGKLLISMARWNSERFPLAMKIVQLAELGVQIEIITRNNPQIVDEGILKVLSHRPNITLHTADVDRLNIHSKYILFDGYYDDGGSPENSKSKKILWVGSYNFTGMAMRSNYETWSEVRDDKIFQDYSANFAELKSLVPADMVSSDSSSNVRHDKNIDDNGD